MLFTTNTGNLYGLVVTGISSQLQTWILVSEKFEWGGAFKKHQRGTRCYKLYCV